MLTSKSDELKRVSQCLYRSQKSRIYYAILKRNGKQIKRSLRTTDQALAKRRLADFSQRASQLSSDAEGDISFEELSKRWLRTAKVGVKPSSSTRMEGIVKGLNTFFGPSQARRVSKGMIEAWAAKRGEQIAARTFNYEREVLVRIFELAKRDGVLLDNPATVVKRRKMQQQRAVIPTKEQYRKLIEAMGTLRADAGPAIDLCELLAYSGCRLSEATALRWGDIDFRRKHFVVTGGKRGTKNYESRVVPLFPSLEDFLHRLLETFEGEPQPDESVIEIQSAKKAMASACKKAELPHFTHHHLRHFFCSNAIEAGIDFKTIAGWLGHKDGGLLVAKTYGHLRDEHSALMAERMTFGVHDD